MSRPSNSSPALRPWPRRHAKNIKPEPKLGLAVLTTWATDRMTASEFAHFRSELAAALTPWGDRGLWLQLSEVPGSRTHSDFQLAGYRLKDGRLQARVLARVTVGAASPIVSNGPANAAFLA